MDLGKNSTMVFIFLKTYLCVCFLCLLTVSFDSSHLHLDTDTFLVHICMLVLADVGAIMFGLIIIFKLRIFLV